MDLEIGAIVSGKVTGITKFGVFVALQGGKSGMVHISEVAPTFVREIRDYVTENQEITVKVVSIDKEGRIGLSIKRAMVQNTAEATPAHNSRPAHKVPMEFEWRKNSNESLSFEDKLSKFKQDSDEKMLALKRCVEGKRGSVGRRPNCRQG